MKRISIHPLSILVFLVTLILAVSLFPVSAQQTSTPQDLKGLDVFDTGAFPCGTPQNLQWVNDGQAIRIFQSQVWMGMFKTARSDFWMEVRRHGDGSIVHRGNWDHYAEPTGLPDQIHFMNFTPNYIRLETGDALDLHTDCSHISGSTVAQVVVTMWYANE